MKDIVLEIDFNAEHLVEKELVMLGNKCDVDLDHTPFKEFSIHLIPTKEHRNELIKEMAKRYANKYVKDNNLQIDALKHLEVIKEFEKNINNSNTDDNFLSEIDAEFTDKGLHLTQHDYDANILINKRKFNMSDSGLKFEIEVAYHENPDSSLFNYSLEKEIYNNVRLVFGICAFLQTSKVEVPHTKKANFNTSNKNTKKKKRNKKTYLYNKIYKINENTLKDTLHSPSVSSAKGKRQYHLSSWYQRGHWRTYKNGKKVWIEAQFKHPRNISEKKENTKTYKITKI